MEYLIPEGIFDGQALRTGKALVVEDGIVTNLCDTQVLPEGSSLRHDAAVYGPPLFDVQVNGGGGVMLNSQPTRDGVRRVAEAHNQAGTGFLLPTVITDRPEVTEKAALAVAAELGRNGVSGIHIEGPHISLQHKGTHNPELIRPFDARTLTLLEQLRARKIPVLLTLAPECVPPGLIAGLTKMGVRVSAGHSAASAEITKRALDEGLCCFTHLFNGMPPMTSRHPMITGAAINSEAWCGIIADGHHVDAQMLQLAIRARPVANRMILVSDAMSTIGGPDSFELYGETIHVSGGRLVNAAGSLAGAHIDLKSAVAFVIEKSGVQPAEALKMAGGNAFAMMGLEAPDFVGQPLRALTRLEIKSTCKQRHGECPAEVPGDQRPQNG